LEESVQLGVKEYYFTGGEPFLNPEMTAILEETLIYGPATVLTNGTIFKEDWLTRLQKAESRSNYSLEFRVFIDGYSAEMNDPISGQGTFDRAMQGVKQLVEHGFLPIITVAKTSDDQDDAVLVQRFQEALRAHGYSRPRLKTLPTIRLGAEVQRQRGYSEHEKVTNDMMKGFDQSLLICNHSRLVSDRGVHVCPILLEAPDALLGQSLAESMTPYPLRNRACCTCYQYGTLCANPSSGNRDA
jgi:molybdenum cofactor biosynthesis enzyme MoaA